MAELARTAEAISGLLDVYRSYCENELRQRVAEGRDRLDGLRRCTRDERARQRATEAAEAAVGKLDVAIVALEGDERRLRSEIAALEESRVYRSGQELDALRDLVAGLANQLKRAGERVADGGRRAEGAAEQLMLAQRRGRDDKGKLNDELAAAAELGGRCHLAGRPPGPVEVPESALVGVDAGAEQRAVADIAELTEPAELGASGDPAQQIGAFDVTTVDRGLAEVAGAVTQRRADVDEVGNARLQLDAAGQRLDRAEAAHDLAGDAAERAAERLGERTRQLGAARLDWAERTRLWAAEVHPLLRAAAVDAPAVATIATLFPAAGFDALTTAVLAARPQTSDRDVAEIRAAADPTAEDGEAADDNEVVRGHLLSEADDLVGHWRDAVAAVDFRLAEERAAVDEAQAHVDKLAVQTEPDPPRLGWQVAADHCLADLVDFAPHLGPAERAGIEAALEASGLLSARPVGSGAVELATGELVAIVAGGVRRPLSDHLTVTVPERVVGEADEGLVAKLLESISCDTSSDAAAAVGTDGTFRVGSLRGRHAKERAEFIGVTARRAALDRARQEAAETLASARAAVAAGEAERARHSDSLENAQRQRSALPVTGQILTALAEAAAATAAAADAETEKAAATGRAAEAERAASEASNALQRVATTLALPADRGGLDEVRQDLTELTSVLDRCRSRSGALQRSLDEWRSAADRWRVASADLQSERGELAKIESKHGSERARLVTIEDSIGAEYAEVVATRDRCKVELDEVEVGLPNRRSERDRAVERRAESLAAARGAVEKRVQAAQSCDATRLLLTEVLATPGLLDAVAGDETAPLVARSAGPDGLRELLEAVERLPHADPGGTTPDGTAPDSAAPDGTAPDGVTADGASQPRAAAVRAPGVDTSRADGVNADGVRQSLRQRRDTLGAGWDAEERQPDPALPLVIEVTGPSGRAPLASSARAVSQQHQDLANLLDHKQRDALRELLQGRIASELAEKVDGAARLVKLMNERLGSVSTAHQVGVRLRWRRSPELDPPTARLVELLGTRPDLRIEEDERELRGALSDRLDEARVLQPDVPYRQLIADTLDYKQWHEMSVMLHREGDKVTRLGRRTPLSEGEKKIVTYLPLFAAVAASYDALAGQQGAPGDGRPGIARFVLLDDAFAKVSEDNHAALFGVLVDLDLDLIATSERLWGTHATVPELAITEVVRDATLGAILLEHYRWDGTTLARQGAP